MTKKITFVLIAFLLLFIGVTYFFVAKKGTPVPGQLSQQNKQTSYKNITSRQLKTMLAGKDFFFVNVHIPYEGEIEKTDAFIPYNKIEQNLGSLPDNKNTKIVLYCRSGRMSKVAAEKLTALGYTNIYNLTAGTLDWEKQGYSLTLEQR